METIRVAAIGCGGFQTYRLSNLFKVPNVEVCALVDPVPTQIDKIRAAYPERLKDAVAFPDHQTMLKEAKPDAVMIATPHTTHCDQVLDSLAAGVHTCCEKPLVTSIDDAHRVIAARDKARKVGMVSYQRHYQAEFRWIKERLASGKSGPIQFVQVLQGQPWLRLCAGTWRHEKALSGGGQLNDSGSHVIDIVLWVTGLKAETVSANIENFHCEVDINSAVNIRFQGGALGSFNVVGNGYGFYEDITIFCEEEVFYMREGKLSVCDRGEHRFKAEHISGGSTPDQNFIDAIRGTAVCESPFECGLEVIRLTEAAWQSAEKGGIPVSPR